MLPRIDENNWQDFTDPSLGRGLDVSCRSSWEGLAAPFDPAWLIPKSEWLRLAKEQDVRGSGLYQLLVEKGLEPLNQQRTLYCWANAPTSAAMALMVVQNQLVVPLSPASVAAPIKKYANIGGWPTEAVAYANENGWCPQSAWAANAIDPSLDTKASRELRRYFRPLHWMTLYEYGDGTSYEERERRLMSMLLRRFPVAHGRLGWSHATCDVGVDPDTADPVTLNSWGKTWGKGGYGKLSGGLKVGEDAVALMLMTGG